MRTVVKSLFSVAMSLALITGCSSGTSTTSGNSSGQTGQAAQTGTPETKPAENTELSFFYPVAVGGPLTKIVDGMAEEFNKANPGITVKPVYTGSYQDTTTKIQAAVQGKTPPDVAVMLSTELHTMMDMDAILPLDEFIAKDGGSEYVNDFFPGFLANSQVDGKTYSIPFQRSTIVLYYNKEAFKEVGLDPEKPPATWEELAEYASKLTKDGRWGLEIPSSGFTYWMYQALALQNGKNLMTEDGKKVFFDTPENVEALQYWVDLAKKHKAMPEGVIEWATVPSDFLEGKTAMMFHTTGNLTNVKNNAKFDFGVAFLPAKKNFGSPTGGGNFYMFKGTDTKKQEAAWKFIRFMTEPKRAAQWSIDTGYVATRKSAYEEEIMKQYVKDFPAAAVARDQLEYGHAEFSTHNNGKVTKALNDNLQAVITGKASAAEALKKAQEEADKVLAPFNK
ncbi:ABC transporter substrate-binding protein [Brevibacillus agri]|uniref:ABC transporter substrate-binding protein n=1 Tax=Brevibacillus agri TaxID=51101 RepID=UPI0002A5043A|nr:ABC transporter substrate-binding protein [Brevibacillus agri]ELK43940.1 glycerol-3-phosphate ABC transporter substrate-binding protein [Brevibacillus agri BAB-2500]MED1822325.1 ABC transporter substrate-binding protein [Brevibacillus agri]MED4568981.1 ABC transporter substrate-binding protein [Brevibacillus agri]WHX30628.1 ABC transporter substrate-binding protein [Brevibacillus agri]